jgi:hypothetical protein
MSIIGGSMWMYPTPPVRGAVHFIKVHTGVFTYSSIFGSLSTELYSPDFPGPIDRFPPALNTNLTNSWFFAVIVTHRFKGFIGSRRIDTVNKLRIPVHGLHGLSPI